MAINHLKTRMQPTHEISCTLNIPQTMDSAQYNTGIRTEQALHPVLYKTVVKVVNTVFSLTSVSLQSLHPEHEVIKNERALSTNACFIFEIL